MFKFSLLLYLLPLLAVGQYDFEDYKFQNDSIMEYVYRSPNNMVYNDRACITDVKTQEGECKDMYGKYTITREQDKLIEVYKNGTMRREVQFDQKVRTGLTTIYHPIIGYKFAEFNYKEGKLWNVTYFNQDGVVLDNGGFKDGAGNLNYFRFTGELQKTVAYQNGVASGNCSYYYADGKIMATGSYKYGRPDGWWREFNREGKEVQLTKMAMGILVKTEHKGF